MRPNAGWQCNNYIRSHSQSGLTYKQLSHTHVNNYFRNIVLRHELRTIIQVRVMYLHKVVRCHFQQEVYFLNRIIICFVICMQCKNMAIYFISYFVVTYWPFRRTSPSSLLVFEVRRSRQVLQECNAINKTTIHSNHLKVTWH